MPTLWRGHDAPRSPPRSRHARQGRDADRGAALSAALRRADLRGEIWRPRDGRPGDGEELRLGHRVAQDGRHQSGGGAWRRAADRIDAQASRRRIALRRRPARHRRGDCAHRRDGAGRIDQQGNRRLDRPGGRQGRRPVGQGCAAGGGREGRPLGARQIAGHRAPRRSRLRRRAQAYRHHDPAHAVCLGVHSRDRADRHRRGRPDLQHQRRYDGGARSPARSRRRGCSC